MGRHKDETLPETRQVTVRMPVELWEKLDRLAIEAGRMVTPSEIVRRLIIKEPDPQAKQKRKETK